MSDARIVLAIDPGPKQSGICEYFVKGDAMSISGWILPNEDVLPRLRIATMTPSTLVIEAIVSQMQRVGDSTFETCYAIGQFLSVWNGCHEYDNYARLVRRSHIMSHLCTGDMVKGTADKRVRQALIARFGGKGTKKAPGTLYDFKDHMWSALGIAVTYAELGDEITELYGRRV